MISRWLCNFRQPQNLRKLGYREKKNSYRVPDFFRSRFNFAVLRFLCAKLKSAKSKQGREISLSCNFRGQPRKSCVTPSKEAYRRDDHGDVFEFFVSQLVLEIFKKLWFWCANAAPLSISSVFAITLLLIEIIQNFFCYM